MYSPVYRIRQWGIGNIQPSIQIEIRVQCKLCYSHVYGITVYIYMLDLRACLHLHVNMGGQDCFTFFLFIFVSFNFIGITRGDQGPLC